MTVKDIFFIANSEELADAAAIYKSNPHVDTVAVLEKLVTFRQEGCEPATVLGEFRRKKTTDITPFELKKGRGSGYHVFADLYVDASYSFGLLHAGKPIAVISFSPGREWLTIEQIQGAKGQEALLKDFRWPAALVHYVCTWAQKLGIPEVGIVGAANNSYVTTTFNFLKRHGAYDANCTLEQAARLSHEQIRELTKNITRDNLRSCITMLPHQAFIRYDLTARSLGFAERNGNYFKNLEIKESQ